MSTMLVMLIWQLDDDARRVLDDISRSDAASLTHHQLVDSNAVWRTGSEPDTTSDLLQRLFDELLFYLTDQVDNTVRIITITNCACETLHRAKKVRKWTMGQRGKFGFYALFSRKPMKMFKNTGWVSVLTDNASCCMLSGQVVSLATRELRLERCEH